MESDIRDNIMIDSYVIMPNHIHAIIIIQNPVGCDRIAPKKDNKPGKTSVGCDCIALWTDITSGINIAPRRNNQSSPNIKSYTGTMQSFLTLSRMIRWLKWRITSQIQQNYETWYMFWWQKSYYDVIIRNEEQLLKTQQYICDNPINWDTDSNNI